VIADLPHSAARRRTDAECVPPTWPGSVEPWPRGSVGLPVGFQVSGGS